MTAHATLRNQTRFDRHSIGLIGGGLAAGPVSGLLGLIVGQQVPALSALSFAAVVGLAVNLLDPREDTALLRLILALIGGVLMGALMQVGFVGAQLLGAAVAGGFIGAGLTFDRCQSRARFLRGVLLFGIALPAGGFSAATLFPEHLLQLPAPFFVREALVGAIWGLFMAVAAGLSDLRVERDEVLGALDAALSRHKEPVRDYLESARELYLQVLRESGRTERQDTRRRAGEIARETVESQLQFAARFEELRAALQTTGADRLARRMERLDRRVAQTDNPAIAREIAQARDDVREQMQTRDRLELACARLEGRLQRCLTTLEKLHLTLVQHASNHAHDVGLTESLARLEQFAEEVQFQNLSVDELCELSELDGLYADGEAAADVDLAVGVDVEHEALSEEVQQAETEPVSTQSPR